MIRHKLIKMMVAVGLIMATTVTTAFAVTYGWEQKGNDWYYMQYDNQYAKGVSSISGKIYQFDESGKLLGDYKEPVVSTTIANYSTPVSTKSVARSSINESVQLTGELNSITTVSDTEQLSEQAFSNAVGKEMFKLVNEHRASLNLPAFRWSEELSQSAKWKSEDMVSRNYFAHNWEGVWYTDIIKNGCGIKIGSENIYYGSDYPNRTNTETFAELIARGMFGSWKNSPGHNKQMISTDYSEFGFGYAKNNSNGFLYGTQHFR